MPFPFALGFSNFSQYAFVRELVSQAALYHQIHLQLQTAGKNPIHINTNLCSLFSFFFLNTLTFSMLYLCKVTTVCHSIRNADQNKPNKKNVCEC